MKNNNSNAGNTMRKFLATALAVPMALSVFVPVLAEEPANTKDVDIQYEVEQSYEWSVPSSISADDGAVEVKVTKNVIQAGKALKITVDSANNFVLKNTEDETDTIEYSITANSKAWTDGGTVLTVESGVSSGSVIGSAAIVGTPTGAGTYKDTLTFTAKIDEGITYIDKAVFPTLRTQYPNATFNPNTQFKYEYAPFIYQNLDYFKNKTITKIGLPVGTIKPEKSEQTFTVYVMKNNTTAITNQQYVKEYTLTAPTTSFEHNDGVVNKWLYFENLDIEVGADETLAFFKRDNSDTVIPNFYDQNGESAYKFYCLAPDATQHTASNGNIYIDIYYKQAVEELESVQTHVFPNITTTYDNSKISGLTNFDYTAAPFIYKSLNLFESKKIVQIGFPVKKVSALDENQYVTVRVVSNSFVTDSHDTYDSVSSEKTYQFKLPKSELGTNKDAVNKWIYVDCNIQLAAGETLAFTKSGDPVTLGYDATGKESEYNFWARAIGGNGTQQLLFDVVYETAGYKEITDVDLYLLKQQIQGKYLSILGDSISTFAGYNTDTNANSTIGNNKVWYNGSQGDVSSVNQTWWLKTANDTGMKLLVNNSASGSKVLGVGCDSKSTSDQAYETRPLNLHDDTGDRAGTNPDIIAVYIGTNDVNNSGTIGTVSDTSYTTLITDNGNGTFNYATPTTSADAYIIMVHKMITKYPDAKIFLFTLNQCATMTKNDQDRIKSMNTVIKAVAAKYSLNVVDLYNEPGFDYASKGTHSIDSLHPNTIGMQYIENAFIKALKAEYVK